MSDWFKIDDKSRPQDPAVDDLPFLSRRSPVLCRNGCVASSQPLASSIGLQTLLKGGNAADAAISVAAALAVTEPCSTGLGGDMFCLYYDSKTRQVSSVNGSGFSPAGLNLDLLRKDCGDGNGGVDRTKFNFSAHAVTVPGAARGYEDLYKRHGSGKLSFFELLEPAAELAEQGFPVAPVTSFHWRNGLSQIKKWVTPGDPVPLTVDGRNGPMPGEIIRNPDVARVLRELGKEGAEKGFYGGPAGKAIAEAVQKHGGTLCVEDMEYQTCSFPEPIFAQYRDYRLWQIPPNGQGVAGLVALKGLQHLEESEACSLITPQTIGTADAYHTMIEMMRLGFADATSYVADERNVPVSMEWLLDADRIGNRAKEMFHPKKAVIAGKPLPSSCTVSFQVVDSQGNAISFVNSNYMGFGTGMVPDGCGFTLQNRGAGFSLDATHPNVVAPRKRPKHTIIPGMITHADNDELHSTISNMGGNMQPQGHLQLTVAMIAGGLDPQAAIDLPRFCIADGTKDGIVKLESGVNSKDEEELKRRGHPLDSKVKGHDKAVFGRAQIIVRDRKTGVLWAGSDGRADGCAIGY